MSSKNRDPNRKRQRHRARAAERRHQASIPRPRATQQTQAQTDQALNEAIGFNMTAVLLELIEPLLKQAANTDEAEVAVLLGITAWNFANLPPEEGRHLVETTSAEIAQRGPEAVHGYAEAIASLLLRKQMLFSHLDTIITEYSIGRTEDGFDLQVIHGPLAR